VQNKVNDVRLEIRKNNDMGDEKGLFQKLPMSSEDH
jgi:hypothetical protein